MPGGIIIVHSHMRGSVIKSALEPNNSEYRNLVNRFENGGSWYQQRQYTYGSPVAGNGNLCLKLCIANLLCNLCCGGGGLCCGGGPYVRY